MMISLKSHKKEKTPIQGKKKNKSKKTNKEVLVSAEPNPKPNFSKSQDSTRPVYSSN